MAKEKLETKIKKLKRGSLVAYPIIFEGDIFPKTVLLGRFHSNMTNSKTSIHVTDLLTLHRYSFPLELPLQSYEWGVVNNLVPKITEGCDNVYAAREAMFGAAAENGHSIDLTYAHAKKPYFGPKAIINFLEKTHGYSPFAKMLSECSRIRRSRRRSV